MKIEFDPKADALYIRLKRGKVYKTVARNDAFLVDLDKHGDVLGCEVIHYSKAVPDTMERLSVFVGQKKLTLPT